MKPILRRLTGAMLAPVCAVAIATDPGPAPVPSTTAPVSRQDPVRTALEQMPETELKHFYIDCSRMALRGTLGFGGAATCSIAYEVLLRDHFDGDFAALLRWSRQNR